MPTVNFLADHVSYQAAYKYVGGEMLPRTNARVVHKGREPVREQFRNRARILVRDHAGHRPRNRGVFGRKSASSTEKGSASVSFKWTLPSQRIFHDFCGEETVQRRFTSQKSGLAPMLAVGRITQ